MGRELRSKARGKIRGINQTGKEEVNVKEMYYIDKLVGKRVREGSVEYHVKWTGYESKLNTWEPFRTLVEDCPQIVHKFEAEREQKLSNIVVDLDDDIDGGSAETSNTEERENLIQDNAVSQASSDEANDSYESDHNVEESEDADETCRNKDDDDDDDRNRLEVAEGDAIAGETDNEGKADEKNASAVKKAKTEKKNLDAHSSAVPTTSRKSVVVSICKMIPECILGATHDNDSQELQFLVKWKHSEVVNLVKAKEANTLCPHLVIRFYEKRLLWKVDDELPVPLEDIKQEVDSDGNDGSDED